MKITSRKYAQALALMLDTVDKTIIGNFLQVLARRRQRKLLPKILRAFDEEWFKQRDIKKIEILYPKNFQSSVEELDKKIEDLIGEKTHIRVIPSESLIGGFKVKVEDTLIDASIEGRLAALARRLNK